MGAIIIIIKIKSLLFSFLVVQYKNFLKALKEIEQQSKGSAAARDALCYTNSIEQFECLVTISVTQFVLGYLKGIDKFK